MPSYIGCMFNLRPTMVSKNIYFIFRAIPIAKHAEQSGFRAFFFNPASVDRKTHLVSGFILEKNRFVAHTAPVPKACGDWYLGPCHISLTPKFSLTSFESWAEQNGISIFPHPAAKMLVKDKLACYKFFDKRAKFAMPKTYPFSPKSLFDQLKKHQELYLKPQFGRQGNKIIVVRKTNKGFETSHTDNQVVDFRLFPSPQRLLRYLHKTMGKDPMITQESISSAKIVQSKFVIRVIAYDNGRHWSWFAKAVLAPLDYDCAATTQGGSNLFLDQTIRSRFGAKKEKQIIRDLESTCTEAFDLLTHEFGHNLMEIAFDLTLDSAGVAHLIEVNTKPGVTKPGTKFIKTFSDLVSEEKSIKLARKAHIDPYGEQLAQFLISKDH